MNNVEIAEKIMTALSEIKPEDRSGFLFGMALQPMVLKGWSKEKIREELLKGLDIAIDFLNKKIS